MSTFWSMELEKQTQTHLILKLHSELKCMMIHILVDIEHVECVIWMTGLDIARNRLSAIDRDQVCGPVYGIQMDNSYVYSPVWESWRANPPHASVVIGSITNLIKPLYHHTWISSIIIDKRKKWQYSSYIKAWHAVAVFCRIPTGIGPDENTILVGIFISPVWCWANVLSPHSLNATNITQRIESRAGWIECIYAPFKLRIFCQRHKLGFMRIVRMELFE